MVCAIAPNDKDALTKLQQCKDELKLQEHENQLKLKLGGKITENFKIDELGSMITPIRSFAQSQAKII